MRPPRLAANAPPDGHRAPDAPTLGRPAMNIHEYQAKQLLKRYGAPVADGVVVLEAGEAEAKAKGSGAWSSPKRLSRS